MFSFLANLVDSLGFWISILMIGFIVYAILYTKFHKKKPKKWVKPETSEKVQNFINFFSSVVGGAAGTKENIDDARKSRDSSPGLHEASKYGAVRRDEYGNLRRADGSVVDLAAEAVKEQTKAIERQTAELKKQTKNRR